MTQFNYIPLKPKSKAPIVQTWQMYQKEKVSPKLLEAWKKAFPNCNWGIVTGKISGIVVIDVDDEEALDNLGFSLDKLNTPIVKTGKGYHIYFKHPGDDITVPNKVGILPHVDVRGDGGYVVAPPSIHSNGHKYTWLKPKDTPLEELPQWLLDKILSKPAQTKTNEENWVVKALEGVAEGERNNTAAKLCGYFFGKKVPKETVIALMRDWNTKNKPPLDDQELMTIIDSIYKKESHNFLTPKGKPIIGNIVSYFLNNHHFIVADDRLLMFDKTCYIFDVDKFIGNWLYRNIGAENNTDYFRNKVIRNLIDACPLENRVSMLDLLTWEKDKINLRNGVLDVNNMELRPHSPKYYFLHQFPVEYAPEADCPTWKKFLETTLDQKYIPTLQEFMGYCLIPNTKFQKAMLLYGTGANGKSIVINTLLHLLGEKYTSTASLDRIQNNRFAAAQLVGKLLNASSETVSYSGNELDIFKAIVGGDAITVEEKGKPPMTVRLATRLLFASNTMLRSGDQTTGNYRRWLIIPFEKQFLGDDADPFLQDKIDQELSGILNWCLEGLQRLLKQGKFSYDGQEMIDRMMYENDSVVAHVQDCCILDENATVAAKVLYENYKQYCEEAGLRKVSMKAYFSRLVERYPHIEKVKTSKANTYVGIGIAG